jgi:hypothetical protein
MNWNRAGFFLTSIMIGILILGNHIDASKSELEFIYLLMPVFILLSWFNRGFLGYIYEGAFKILISIFNKILSIINKIWKESGK